jgi:hypothetical protein
LRKHWLRYLLYLLRWQCSTPILAVCVVYFAKFGNVWATVIANLIGGLIFYWVDRFIFLHQYQEPVWAIKDDIDCFDCGTRVSRGYRLVKARGYDRSFVLNPQWRCESCSKEKFDKMFNL